MCAAQRDGIDASLRKLAAERLAACGIGFAGAFAGATISAYAAIGSELDAFPLLERLAREGYRLALPVVTPLGNPLVFRAWAPGEPLVPAKWDIREPAGSAPAVEPDVLLVPLLAFDDDGNRLGYGGGYYDRTLRRLRSMKPIIGIGLAYDTQEIGEVPVEPHDQRLDFVLTPSGGRKLG
jgi:5-formyltetrahydrofolate cyclo-ligase